MTDIIVRSGHLHDLSSVMDLVQRCCRDLWPQMDDVLIDAHRRLAGLALRCHHRELLVARSDETIVGALVADKLGFGGPEFNFVLVDSHHRRRGLGRLLLGAGCHWLGNYPASRLFVPDQCQQLMTFSRQLGLEPSGPSHTRLSVHGQFHLLLPDRAEQLTRYRRMSLPACPAVMSHATKSLH